MPDCSNDALKDVLRDLKDNLSAGTTVLIDKIQSVNYSSGLSSAVDVLGDVGLATLESIASRMIANQANFSFIEGLGSTGQLLATILSSGQLAYLGIMGFLFSMLRFELEARYIVMSNILTDLNTIETLVNLLINLIDKSGPQESLLQRAYEKVWAANQKLEDINSQLQALNYYDSYYLSSVTNNLTDAQDIMETPIMDAIAQMAEDAHFLPQALEITGNVFMDPRTAMKELYIDWIGEEIGEDGGQTETRNQDYTAYTTGKAASRQQQLSTFMTGIMDYLDYSGTPAYLNLKIKELGMNIVKYLPLDPRAKAALLLDFAPALSAAPEERTALVTVDFRDISYRNLIADNGSTDRSLKTLNDSIKTRVKWLSKLEGNWEGFNLVGNINTSAIGTVFEELKAIKDDMEKYVPHPIKSPDQTKPEKAIPNNVIKSAKFSAWRSRIESVKRNLDTINRSTGQQAESLGESYENLNALVNKLNQLQYEYGEEDLYSVTGLEKDKGVFDENDNTPESDDAYLQLKILVSSVFDNLGNRDALLKIRNQISEARLSVTGALSRDNSLIGDINIFTSEILNSDGMKQQLAFIDGILQDEEITSKNNTLKYIIDELKMGNIQLVTSLGIGAVQEGVALGQGLVENLPSRAEISEAFSTAMAAAGSGFSNIGDCLGQLGRPRMPKDISDATEKALQEQLVLDEDFNMDNAAIIESDKVINDKLNLIQGVDVPDEEIPLSPENINKVKDASREAYQSLGILTVDDFIT